MTDEECMGVGGCCMISSIKFVHVLYEVHNAENGTAGVGPYRWQRFFFHFVFGLIFDGKLEKKTPENGFHVISSGNKSNTIPMTNLTMLHTR